MQFLHSDLGQLKKGAVVRVTLANQANVRVMTSSDFQNFRKGRRHHFLGGGAKKSPVRIPIPRDGRWHLVIDLGGHAGKIRYSVDIEQPPTGILPEMRSPQPVAVRHTEVREPQQPTSDYLGGRTWDVFISHASEDKAGVARPLYEALGRLGIDAWLDEAQMKLGQSLRRRIDEGIRASRFGVVILSRAYFGKGWTEHELDGLVTRSVAGEQSLLPIWHNLEKDDVLAYSPSLADKVAVLTQRTSIEEIAEQIADVVTEAKAP